MNRSDVNNLLREAETFIGEQGFVLPPFAKWTPEDWKHVADAVGLAIPQLGWDITDFGSGDFSRCGLVLFTLRNGTPTHLDGVPNKPYAEKLLIIKEAQVTPMHCHRIKTEDIINRSGATLVIELRQGTSEGIATEADVTVSVDGRWQTVPCGGRVTLQPGESITLEPYCFHSFWAEGGDVLAGEVSSVNDDTTDNLFLDASGRFPEIEEDATPYRLLVGDYQAVLDNRFTETAS